MSLKDSRLVHEGREALSYEAVVAFLGLGRYANESVVVFACRLSRDWLGGECSDRCDESNDCISFGGTHHVL